MQFILGIKAFSQNQLYYNLNKNNNVAAYVDGACDGSNVGSL